MKDLAGLLGVLAHEMRTPIAAILGYQELLAEGIVGHVDERGKEPLSRIGYSAHQLLHLIDGVQEITAPPSKRPSMRVAPFPPADSLRKCLEESAPDAGGRNVQIESDIPDDLPMILGDVDRFCRAVDLTLAAAIKASYGNTLKVSAAKLNGEVLTTIDQTGLSLDRDNPDFAQSAEESGRLSGPGLRLAIVREIARQMKGDLELSPNGTTTRVVLRLPAS